MLSYRANRFGQARFAELPAKQRGVTLLITLIVLVAMTLAAISLMRSVDTTNVIAGNLAFRQSTISESDAGIEAAIAWLEQSQSANPNNLYTANKAAGYIASQQVPPTGLQGWDWWWNQTALGTIGVVPTTDPITGNTVSYAIERLCNIPGNPVTNPNVFCSKTPVLVAPPGCPPTPGSVCLVSVSLIYYRITSRTDGPHNSVSYAQAIVVM